VSDYAHIPIHIRLTDRERIDPNYTRDNYNKREHLLTLCRAAGRWYTRRDVPESVLRWIEADSFSRLGPAAVELNMEAEDLRAVVRRYRGRNSA